MFHRSRTISILVFAGLGLACAGDSATGVAVPFDAVDARAPKVADSRARYTFHNTMMDGTTETAVRGDNRLADGSSANGGASVYQGQLCGVHGKIFWYDAHYSRSGDAVFDPAKDRATCGTARKVNIPPFGLTGVSSNFAAIMQLAAGEERFQQFGFGIGRSGCERLRYTVEVGSNIRVRRISGNTTGDPGTWQAESVGTHQAGCFNFVAGAWEYQGVSYFLPLHVTIEEIR